MRRLRVKLPATDIDERPVGQPSEHVTVCRHGSWGGIERLALMASDPNCNSRQTSRFEGFNQLLRRNPTLARCSVGVGKVRSSANELVGKETHRPRVPNWARRHFPSARKVRGLPGASPSRFAGPKRNRHGLPLQLAPVSARAYCTRGEPH